jgi:ribonuclease III
MNTRAAAVQDLERTLDYAFGDPALLERALTHASVGEGAAKVANNEVLEFIGDRVLGLLVAEILAERHPKAAEGELARRLNRLVSRDTCALVAESVGLGPALRMSGSATRIGARERGSVLAGAVEALIAAVYADGGLEAARALFMRLWGPYLDQDVGAADRRDPKTALQEWAHAAGVPAPVYSVLSRNGPDHAPVFLVQAEVKGLEPVTGKGPSRREAEKRAAEALLTREGVQ